MTSDIYHIHLVSDSTGETLESIANAALAQFKDRNVNRHYWPLMRTPIQMERVVDDIVETPGLVMYTLVNKEIRNVLEKKCRTLNLPILSVLDPVINLLGSYLGAKAARQPGLQHIMDAEYFDRIDAVHYTMAHDDGQMCEDLSGADIVIVGVSRTSKTPTSMYLANKGFCTANIPFVPNCPLPSGLDHVEDKFVIGLTTSPDRLIQIRENRLISLKEDDTSDYTDFELVREEVKLCRRLCSENSWPVIDVTRRSIEESAVAILNLYQKWKVENAERRKNLVENLS